MINCILRRTHIYLTEQCSVHCVYIQIWFINYMQQLMIKAISFPDVISLYLKLNCSDS